jgi:DnaK suppressor protein
MKLEPQRHGCENARMADLDMAAVERALRARQAELHDRIERLARPPERGAGLQFGKRIGDGTAEAVSRLTDVGVGPSLEASEARIERALEKLREGNYGRCDRCSEPISPARLGAAPESVLCIECMRSARR